MTNVINFIDAMKKAKQVEIDEMTDDTIDDVLECSIHVAKQTLEILAEEGFDVYDEKHAYDVAMLVEAIKGLTYNTVGVNFPTQHLARILFEIPDENEFIESFID